MRQRKHGFGSGTERGGDTRNDFDREPGGAHCLDFLTAAPENEGIAPFQAHDNRASFDVGNDQGIDAILGDGVAVALLGDIDTLCRGADIVEHAVVDEAVMDNDIGLAERLNGFDRQQTGITRPRTNENDATTRFRVKKTEHRYEMAVGAARGKRN